MCQGTEQPCFLEAPLAVRQQHFSIASIIYLVFLIMFIGSPDMSSVELIKFIIFT